MNRLSSFARQVYDRLIRYAIKFGIVGILAYLVDVLVFNLLRIGVFGTGTWFQSPLGATVVSVTVSTVFAWVGNRYWTFREHRRKNYLLELVEYGAVAVVGLGINLACVWISHYVLGFDSLLADNISRNIIGVGLATLFRFLMYRYWVYGTHRKDGLSAIESRRAEAAAMSIFEDDASATTDASSLDEPSERRVGGP
ncbi:GtrA family protein [Agromyces ramosus]|uniref:GtrA family protein n=1 Tax=Agromyces ramosus TaxID=33879 RepID=UPI0013EE902C|nr:GtrA family protein [Agromyces ramosus]